MNNTQIIDSDITVKLTQPGIEHLKRYVQRIEQNYVYMMVRPTDVNIADRKKAMKEVLYFQRSMLTGLNKDGNYTASISQISRIFGAGLASFIENLELYPELTSLNEVEFSSAISHYN